MASAEKSSKDSAQSPACSKKALPGRHVGQGGGEPAGLAGEHERRQRGQLRLHLLAGDLVGPHRLLERRGGPATTRGARSRPCCRCRGRPSSIAQAYDLGEGSSAHAGRRLAGRARCERPRGTPRPPRRDLRSAPPRPPGGRPSGAPGALARPGAPRRRQRPLAEEPARATSPARPTAWPWSRRPSRGWTAIEASRIELDRGGAELHGRHGRAARAPRPSPPAGRRPSSSSSSVPTSCPRSPRGTGWTTCAPS